MTDSLDTLSTRAIAAAVAVSQAHGLRCQEPRLLSNRSNVLVHLPPAPVVARVATTTAFLRPEVQAWLAREVDLASFLARQGAAVVPPSDELPPGPHLQDGLAISFWPLIQHDASYASTIEEASHLLAELHQQMRHYPGPLPYLDPALDEVERGIEKLSRLRVISIDDQARLRRVAARLEAELRHTSLPVQPLHGDAHRNNLLATSQGLLWNDFEDCCAGPVAWDLACLTRTAPDPATALVHYGNSISQQAIEPYVEARWLQVTIWSLVFAQRFPQFQDYANDRLAHWRQQEG